MTENPPFVILAMPALIGLALTVVGYKAPVPQPSVSGMGTNGDSAMTQNLQLAQQYQSNALTGTLTMLGLLLTPVLSAVGIIWMLRKSR